MSKVFVSVKGRETPFVFEDADIGWNFDKNPNEYIVRQLIGHVYHTVAVFPKVNVLAIEISE